MKNFGSVLIRLVLLSIVLYGSYRVFEERRLVTIFRNEIAAIEKSFDGLIDRSTPEVAIHPLDPNDSFYSWLCHIPAGESLRVVLASSDQVEFQLLTIPATTQTQRRFIHINLLFPQTAPVGLTTGVKKIEFFGPDALVATRVAGDNREFHVNSSAVKTARTQSDKILFDDMKNQPRGRMGLLASRLTLGQPNSNAVTHTCEKNQSIAVFRFVEEDDNNSSTMTLPRYFVVKILADGD
jgi:hypothetical protein